MIKIEEKLLANTAAYAREVLVNQLPAGYTYHTLPHTEQVVEAIREIGVSMRLDEEELNMLYLAGWLHDLGYLVTYIGHEEESMRMARDFLARQQVAEDLIEKVVCLIEATKLDHAPRNTLEEVIKDADLSNLATKEALENSQLIREEWLQFCNREFTDAEWDEFNYNFFSNHEYFTHYAKDQLSPKKAENIRLLKKTIKKRKKGERKAHVSVLEYQLEQQEKEIYQLKRKLKKTKKNRPDRGIETMFRVTYRMHINLSSIADSKSNILLSINALIISLVITDALKDNYQDLVILIPGIMILAVCMATIVFAILATRPKVNSGVFTRNDILEKKTNLLFFGNFYRMEVEDYLWGMDEMMRDGDYLYGSMSKDIYYLGKVLAQKFKYLRVAYNIFMYGMGASVAIAGICFLYVSFTA
ncbi:MAG: Pycsar system effector family protein [Bacteroidota bacterium]